MPYSLSCDSCEFVREIDDDVTAFEVAKDHEAAFANHFVLMERLQ